MNRGTCAQVVRGEYAVSMEYDTLGYPLNERDTAGWEVFYLYDSGGNLVSRKDIWAAIMRCDMTRADG